MAQIYLPSSVGGWVGGTDRDDKANLSSNCIQLELSLAKKTDSVSVSVEDWVEAETEAEHGNVS